MVIIILSFSNILLSGQVAGGWIPIKVVYVQMVGACNSDRVKEKAFKAYIEYWQMAENCR